MDDLRYTVKEQLKTTPGNQLFSYWLVSFCSLLVLALLIFLYPGRTFLQNLLDQETFTDVDYRYSLALLSTKLKNPISYKDVKKNPSQVIRELNETADPQDLDFFRLKYIILRTISQTPKLSPNVRKELDQALAHYLTILKNQPNTLQQQMALARDALAINQSGLALFYAEQVMKKDTSAFSYPELAEIAMWAGQCVKSSEYFFLAQHQAKLINDKRYFFINGIKVLFQCNEYEKAMLSVEKNINGLSNDELTYNLLTQLAVRAGKPDKAQEFVLRLLELQNSAREKAINEPSPQSRFYTYMFGVFKKMKAIIKGAAKAKQLKKIK